MEPNDPVVIIAVALISAFGGVPLFNYLVERGKSLSASRKSDRDALEREREQLRKDREALNSREQRILDNERLELRTLRGAFNEVTETNGRLRGMLDAANERIDELEAEIARLRGNGARA